MLARASRAKCVLAATVLELANAADKRMGIPITDGRILKTAAHVAEMMGVAVCSAWRMDSSVLAPLIPIARGPVDAVEQDRAPETVDPSRPRERSRPVGSGAKAW